MHTDLHNTSRTLLPLSVLDLVYVNEGGTPGDAIIRSGELAQHVENLGFSRFWLAEHHNMPDIASAATAVLVGYIASLTRTVRVGSGGVMLPNHSPLVVAEQFGTLATLFPGRIDLGVGRAPGGDAATLVALRRAGADDTFDGDLRELANYLEPANSNTTVRAIPAAGAEVPIWLLGTSRSSALLAARLGLPYAFAAHIRPREAPAAISAYREHFEPAPRLRHSRALASIAVIVAETDGEAQRLFTSIQRAWLNCTRGARCPLPPPVDSMDVHWSAAEREAAGRELEGAIVGSQEQVKQKLLDFLSKSPVDELMVTTPIYEYDACLRSFELLAEIREDLPCGTRAYAGGEPKPAESASIK